MSQILATESTALNKPERLTSFLDFDGDSTRSYFDYLNQIGADDLYEGLLGYGMMGDKLPPVFTTVPFLEYCKNNHPNFKKSNSGHGFVRYKYVRNLKSFRELGIPNPMAYEQLCHALSEHWDKILKVMNNLTKEQKYKISRVHLRKMNRTKSLFAMNYKSRNLDMDTDLNLLFNARYCVESDIVKCFSSIYTHSVDWALSGKEEAKKRSGKKRDCAWESQLDAAIRYTTNNETHGILLGPHASNLISEIILTKIDSKLSDKYRYIRYIDDYKCYADTYTEAQQFIYDFDAALADYGLSRNVSKTKIVELPRSLESRWTRKLKTYPLPSEGVLGLSDISSFMDYVIDLNEEENDQAIINYAIKMISGRKMNASAREHFAKRCLHLASIYPYLMALMETHVIQRSKVDVASIKKLSDLNFVRAMTEGNYYCAYFTLYFAAKYDFDIEDFDCEAILQKEDCMLKFFAFQYCKKRKKTQWISSLKEHAKEKAKTKQDFDENWVFVYEALDTSDFDEKLDLHGDWIALKEAEVSFANESALNS